jgi:hypothetical protein
MPKNSTGDELAGLILAMSGNERRYFRKQARLWQEGDGITLRLFDHLLAVGRWDEAEIRQVFAGEGFLKQLNVTRTRLHQDILDALRNYDHGRTYQLDFSRRLDEIDVLFRRKLYASCLRAAQAAQRRAAQLQLPLQELSVLHWQLRLERDLGGAQHRERMAALHQRRKQVLEQVSLETALLELHDAMLDFRQQQAAHPAHSMEASDALLQSPLLQRDLATLWFDGKILYCHAHAIHALLHMDFDRLEHWHLQLVVTWEGLPERMRLEEERYFKTYVGYAESVTLAGRMASNPRIMEKLKRMRERNKGLHPMEQARILKIELAWLINTAQFERVFALQEEVKVCLARFADALSPGIRLGLLSNVMVACLILEEWQSLLHWTHAIETTVGPHEQLGWVVRACRWVALYELHDHNALEKALRPHLKADRTRRVDPLADCFFHLLGSTSQALENRALNAMESHLAAQKDQGIPFVNLMETWVQARKQGVRLQTLAARE